MAEQQVKTRKHVVDLCDFFAAHSEVNHGTKAEIIIILSVIVWGLCAHLTGFTSTIFSHDSLRELYTEGIVGYAGLSCTDWKVALGRFLWPVYQRVFRLNGTTIVPFWNGLLGLFWLSITAVIVSKLFNITKKSHLILLAGILTCNLTVIATVGTYIGDFDTNMFGIMLAALAAKQWYRDDKWSWFAVPYLALALGVYQSNISVFVSIVILLSILQLVSHRELNTVFKNGIRAIIFAVLAGILYFLLAKLASQLCHIELTSTLNGIAKLWDKDRIDNRGYLNNLVFAYIQWLYDFVLLDKGILSIMNCCLFICLGLMGIIFLRSKIHSFSKVVVCILVAVLPFGMNIAGFLNGEAHLLMTYSFWLLYIFALLLPERLFEVRNTKFVEYLKKGISVIILIVLVSNVKIANGVYLKKNIEELSTLSYMTRVADFIESVDGFDSQENSVLFIGTPNIKTSDAFSSVRYITGAGATSSISGSDVFEPYFDYILQYPITIVDQTERAEILEKIDEDELDIFPRSNCYLWVDDTLIIKLQ